MQQRRPLGYWLKLLDQLIEENLNCSRRRDSTVATGRR